MRAFRALIIINGVRAPYNRAMPAPKPKPSVLSGKRDPVSQFYRAVERYVKAQGGSVVVIGGIQVIKWPGDFTGNFTIAVKCTGQTPELGV